MSRTPHHSTEPSPALAAFLRGIERRGAVFAALQVGDPEAGDRALLSAMRAFRGAAGQLAMGDWARRFWALLLAAPELREARAASGWPEEFAFLATCGRGPRAALLLRLVAGLSEADAAAVLGIARPTYRLALQRALPHAEDGRPDPDAWRALGEASQQAARALGPDRLAHLARLRDAALHGRRLAPLAPLPIVVPERAPDEAARRRWTWPAIAAVTTACALAIAATFVGPLTPPPTGAADGGQVQVAPLPPAESPAARFDADAALVTHADFDQVRDEQADAPSTDPGFYAWLAAGAPATLTTANATVAAQPLGPVDAAAAVAATAAADAQGETSDSETTDAPR